MARATLLYDADCGLCVWSMAKLLALDRRRNLYPAPISSPEGKAILAGMPEEAQLASWHLSVGGRLYSGGRALAPLARLLPAGAPVAKVAGRFPRASERAYRLVADNRGTLGRLLTAGARGRARKRVRDREAETVPGYQSPPE